MNIFGKFIISKSFNDFAQGSPMAFYLVFIFLYIHFQILFLKNMIKRKVVFFMLMNMAIKYVCLMMLMMQLGVKEIAIKGDATQMFDNIMNSFQTSIHRIQVIKIFVIPFRILHY